MDELEGPMATIAEGALRSFAGLMGGFARVDLKVEQSQVKIEVQYQRTKVICPKYEHKGAIKDYSPSRT